MTRIAEETVKGFKQIYEFTSKADKFFGGDEAGCALDGLFNTVMEIAGIPVKAQDENYCTDEAVNNFIEYYNNDISFEELDKRITAEIEWVKLKE